MPPKTKFNKEAIVDAAFEIAKEKGFSGITARNVSDRLGCSVAPIYVNFATIEDLTAEVVQRVFAISDQLLAKQKGLNLFENIGKASLDFARGYPVLLRELVVQPNPYMDSYETVETAMIEALAEDESMAGWTIDERRHLFLKMRIFQLGLSVMVANGQVPSWLDEKAAEKLLMETGEDLILMQTLKREERKQ